MGRHGALAGQSSQGGPHHGCGALTRLTASALDNTPLEQPRRTIHHWTAAEAARAQAEADESAKGCCLYGQIILGSRESLRKTHFFSLLWAHSQRKWEGESRRSALIYNYAKNWAAETCKQTSAQQNPATAPQSRNQHPETNRMDPIRYLHLIHPDQRRSMSFFGSNRKRLSPRVAASAVLLEIRTECIYIYINSLA